VHSCYCPVTYIFRKLLSCNFTVSTTNSDYHLQHQTGCVRTCPMADNMWRSVNTRLVCSTLVPAYHKLLSWDRYYSPSTCHQWEMSLKVSTSDINSRQTTLNCTCPCQPATQHKNLTCWGHARPRCVTGTCRTTCCWTPTSHRPSYWARPTSCVQRPRSTPSKWLKGTDPGICVRGTLPFPLHFPLPRTHTVPLPLRALTLTLSRVTAVTVQRLFVFVTLVSAV